MVSPRPSACSTRTSISILSIWWARKTCCSVSGTSSVSSCCSARTCIGRLRYRRASVTTSPGMVAENSMVCRPAGVSSRIRSTSGRNPRSSILSASSSTSVPTSDRLQMALADQVEQAPGGAHHDVHARAQRVDLRLVGAPAVQRDHPRPAGLAGRLQVIGDLNRQFPGGDDDQGPGVARARGRLAVQPLQQRDAERQRLARAGPGLADDVLAGQRDGQDQRLDREGGGDPLGGQALADRPGDAEVGKQWAGDAFRFPCARGQVFALFPGGRHICCQSSSSPYGRRVRPVTAPPVSRT